MSPSSEYCINRRNTPLWRCRRCTATSGEAETLSERMLLMSEFTSRPVDGARRGYPRQRMSPGVSLSFVPFFWTSKRKVLASAALAAGEINNHEKMVQGLVISNGGEISIINLSPDTESLDTAPNAPFPHVVCHNVPVPPGSSR